MRHVTYHGQRPKVVEIADEIFSPITTTNDCHFALLHYGSSSMAIQYIIHERVLIIVSLLYIGTCDAQEPQERTARRYGHKVKRSCSPVKGILHTTILGR